MLEWRGNGVGVVEVEVEVEVVIVVSKRDGELREIDRRWMGVEDVRDVGRCGARELKMGRTRVGRSRPQSL